MYREKLNTNWNKIAKKMQKKKQIDENYRVVQNYIPYYYFVIIAVW